MVQWDLKGMGAVVTGASQGIGAGIAKGFAAAGVKVVAHYRSNQKGAESLLAEVEGFGGTVSIFSADLSEPEGAEALVQHALTQNQRLDILVNNAGSFPNAELLSMTAEEWRSMFANNLDSMMFCTQQAATHMKQRGGAIINIASISALNPAAAHAHYNSSKAAALMLTRSAAQELGSFGITVNAISPGLIGRPGIEEVWPEGVERWLRACPLGRMGTPEDVANMAVFLCSDQASFISGQIMRINGGFRFADESDHRL